MQSVKQKVWKQKDYQENKSYFREKSKQRRIEQKEWFVFIKSKFNCIKCGESDIVCLDFHHIDPKEKDQNVSKLVTDLRSKERILKEIEKCVVLCSNCHRKTHHNLGVV